MQIPKEMQAMVLQAPRQPMKLAKVEVPGPGANQLLVRVHACGVCRTDLHIVDGELPRPRLPLIPGHEIVGTVVQLGDGVDAFRPGDRLGIPWLAWTCGECRYCLKGQENLCERALFTGYTTNGGYAEYAIADSRYCLPLPSAYNHSEAAPFLCAGLIGYRSYRLAGDRIDRLGLYGFGAAAHIITQIAVHQGKQVYAFTRPGDTESQAFARRMGAVWAGDSTTLPPKELDAAIIFAPVGSLIPAALRATTRGGVVVCGGIHMSDIPSFPYSLLWGERMLRSVANLTRRDAEELLALLAQVPITADVQVFPLAEANEALERLRLGQVQGAAVLVLG
jgi:propanol-preferring alcohol dehydrogenase